MPGVSKCEYVVAPYRQGPPTQGDFKQCMYAAKASSIFSTSKKPLTQRTEKASRRYMKQRKSNNSTAQYLESCARRVLYPAGRRTHARTHAQYQPLPTHPTANHSAASLSYSGQKSNDNSRRAPQPVVLWAHLSHSGQNQPDGAHDNRQRQSYCTGRLVVTYIKTVLNGAPNLWVRRHTQANHGAPGCDSRETTVVDRRAVLWW